MRTVAKQPRQKYYPVGVGFNCGRSTHVCIGDFSGRCRTGVRRRAVACGVVENLRAEGFRGLRFQRGAAPVDQKTTRQNHLGMRFQVCGAPQDRRRVHLFRLHAESSLRHRRSNPDFRGIEADRPGLRELSGPAAEKTRSRRLRNNSSNTPPFVFKPAPQRVSLRQPAPQTNLQKASAAGHRAIAGKAQKLEPCQPASATPTLCGLARRRLATTTYCRAAGPS